MIEWSDFQLGTVPQWILAGAGAGWAIVWTMWEHRLFRKGKGCLVVNHDIRAVSGKDGFYTLMVNVVLRNPSRVRVVPESYTLTLWDIQNPKTRSRIPDTGCPVSLNRKKRDAVLEPGEEVSFSFPIPMPEAYRVIMVETEIPDPQGDNLKWTRTDVFEYNPQTSQTMKGGK